jgi:hypothetical protein
MKIVVPERVHTEFADQIRVLWLVLGDQDDRAISGGSAGTFDDFGDEMTS